MPLFAAQNCLFVPRSLILFHANAVKKLALKTIWGAKNDEMPLFAAQNCLFVPRSLILFHANAVNKLALKTIDTRMERSIYWFYAIYQDISHKSENLLSLSHFS
jgi:hypothetical protein